MRYAGRVLVAALVAGLTIGCANVAVHKVSVEKRIEGRDNHVRGFRYYLNRPYIVVSSPVPVSTRYDPVRTVVGLVPDPTSAQPGAMMEVFLLQSMIPPPTPTGEPEVFDFAGNMIVGAKNLRRVTLPAGSMPALVPVSTSKKPDPPALAKADQDPTGVNVTVNPTPTLVGKVGANDDVRIFRGDEKAYLVGGLADSNGQYSLRLPNPLTPGTYKLRAQVAYPNSTLSDKSDPLTLTVLGLPTTGAPPTGAAVDLGAGADNPDAGKTGASSEAAPKPKAAPAPPVPGKTTTDQSTTAASKSSGPALSAFQVIFLPDFEEQYAIRNKNFLAKTQYKYNFSHGTQLDTFSGSYSSVDVPVAIIETIGKLLTTALPALTGKPMGGGGGAAAKTGAKAETAEPEVPQPDFYVKRTLFIEPGVYRLQKSWERVAAEADGMPPPNVAPGLLADMGMTIREVNSVLTKAEHDNETKPPTTPGSAGHGGSGGSNTPPIPLTPGG